MLVQPFMTLLHHGFIFVPQPRVESGDHLTEFFYFVFFNIGHEKSNSHLGGVAHTGQCCPYLRDLLASLVTSGDVAVGRRQG